MSGRETLRAPPLRRQPGQRAWVALSEGVSLYARTSGPFLIASGRQGPGWQRQGSLFPPHRPLVRPRCTGPNQLAGRSPGRWRDGRAAPPAEAPLTGSVPPGASRRCFRTAFAKRPAKSGEGVRDALDHSPSPEEFTVCRGG